MDFSAPVVVALGGNAIIHQGERGTIPEQFEHTLETMRLLAPLLREHALPLLITHGNGPQMGNVMRRNELAALELPTLPMATCVADLQGGMGYMIQQSLQTALAEVGVERETITLITQVEVDPADPGFANPTKPIGRFMDEQTARVAAAEHGWVVGEDAGRGWRRLVASPRPLRVLEAGAVRTLVEAGTIVVGVGGGGIPVARQAPGVYVGVDAVIDKDLASALIGTAVGARVLLILTGVDHVQVGYRTPRARVLERVGTEELRRHLEAGEFAPGSMRPKVEAALEFLSAGGERAVITSPERCLDGLLGRYGTQIEP